MKFTKVLGVRLTDRQISCIKRVYRQFLDKGDSWDCFTPDVARQLEKKGLVEWHGDYYDRVEWNRVVAKLRVVFLTRRGKEIGQKLIEASS